MCLIFNKCLFCTVKIVLTFVIFGISRMFASSYNVSFELPFFTQDTFTLPRIALEGLEAPCREGIPPKEISKHMLNEHMQDFSFPH